MTTSKAIASMANTKPVSNPFAMSSVLIERVEAWAGLSEQERKASNLLVDTLISEGKKPEHFVAFNEKEDKQGMRFRDSMCEHILKGYNDPESYKLYHADPKTLKVKDLALQSYVRDTVRKDYNNLKGALDRRIKKGDAKGKKAPASKTILAKRAVEQAIKYLSEIKEGYAGMPEDVKTLKGLVLMKITK
jgi:hypothetical protein